MASLDLSLDDLIKSRTAENKKKNQPSERKPRADGGPKRKESSVQEAGRAGRRAQQQTEAKVKRGASAAARRGMSQPQQPAAAAKRGGSGSIFDRLGGKKGFEHAVAVSNLPLDVLEKELRELFQVVGAVKKVQVMRDASGKSVGRATVAFTMAPTPRLAVQKYHGVSLDKRVLKVVLGEATPVGGGGGGSGGAHTTAGKKPSNSVAAGNNIRAGLFGTALGAKDKGGNKARLRQNGHVSLRDNAVDEPDSMRTISTISFKE